MKTKGERRDLYRDVTDRMIGLMESGKTIADLGWNASLGAPHNPISGTRYRGINSLLLASAGFADPRFCTFNQVVEMAKKGEGWSVKGQKSQAFVVFYKRLRVREKDDEAGSDTGDYDAPTRERVIPLLRHYPVFNYSQIENAPALDQTDVSDPQYALPDDVRDRIDAFVQDVGATIDVGGFRAFYNHATDRIQVPPKSVFGSESEYYATVLHEVAHWSGAEDRLNRTFGRNRESEAYAREELRAEISAAFLCSRFGIPSKLEAHAGYVEQYLTLLRDDKKEIFRAARDAEQVVNYLLQFSESEQQHERTETSAMAGQAIEGPDGSNALAEPEVFDLSEMFGADLEDLLAETSSHDARQMQAA